MAEYRLAVKALAEAVRAMRSAPGDPHAGERVNAAMAASEAASLALQAHSRQHSC